MRNSSELSDDCKKSKYKVDGSSSNTIDGEKEKHILELCSQTSLPRFFNSWDDVKYILRLSQCKIHRSFTVPKSQPSTYTIKCAYATCPFFICVRCTKKIGEHIYDGVGVHNCDPNDHIITKYKSPAACTEFLARYLNDRICHGLVSIEELGCSVSITTIRCIII
jgi:hypothetical protein